MANPPPDFVNIPFSPDANAMADGAIENLRAKWTDWEPDDADPEIVLIESVAPLAASAESMAAQMPAEAIVAIGALHGIPYDAGTPAQTTVTLTFLDGAGYTVSAGDQVNIDGYAFALNEDVTIAADPDPAAVGPFQVAGVAVSSTVFAQAANALTGALAVSLDLPPYVTAISVDAPTSDGTDPMDDPTYVNLVVAKLRLRADTLVTANDFALEAVLQPGVGFAWAKGNIGREITVVLADPSALPVPASVKAQVGAVFSDPTVRSVNITFFLLDPSYTDVSVDYRVEAVPGQDTGSVQATIDALLAQVLSPLNSVKNSDPFIRVNKMIALIGGLQMVAYVESVTLSSTTPGAVIQPNGDLEMADGMAALPQLGTITGVVDVAS